LKYVPK